MSSIIAIHIDGRPLRRHWMLGKTVEETLDAG
jgi:hypothetical protein